MKDVSWANQDVGCQFPEEIYRHIGVAAEQCGTTPCLHWDRISRVCVPVTITYQGGKSVRVSKARLSTTVLGSDGRVLYVGRKATSVPKRMRSGELFYKMRVFIHWGTLRAAIRRAIRA